MKHSWIVLPILLIFSLQQAGFGAEPAPDPQTINEKEVDDLLNKPIEQSDVLPDLKSASDQGNPVAKVASKATVIVILVCVAAVTVVSLAYIFTRPTLKVPNN